jgi:hypothetical protein
MFDLKSLEKSTAYIGAVLILHHYNEALIAIDDAHMASDKTILSVTYRTSLDRKITAWQAVFDNELDLLSVTKRKQSHERF